MCFIERPMEPELPVAPVLPAIAVELPTVGVKLRATAVEVPGIAGELPAIAVDIPGIVADIPVDPERPIAPNRPAVAAPPEAITTATTTISKRVGRHLSVHRRAREDSPLPERCVKRLRARRRSCIVRPE
jgi:hypothetical protein